MSSPAEIFVKKWEELHDVPQPLDEMIQLIRTSGEQAVREGVTNNPWLLIGILEIFEEVDTGELIEIVRLLLDICPEAAGTPVPSGNDPDTLVYPLHEACQNANIPNDVIEMLLEKSTAGLDHMAVTGGTGIVEWGGEIEVAGTPLHYALYMGGRGTKLWGGGDVAIVKRLVEACPGALMMKDTTVGLTPLHTILLCPSDPDLEVVELLVECNPSVLQERDIFGRYPIHLALQNEYITLDVIEFLIKSSVGVWEIRDNCGYLPMHSLLTNSRIKDTLAINILNLFLRVSPNDRFFREAGPRGKMPIHLAAESGHGVEFCKMLVDFAPGCERIPDSSGHVPLYGARHIDTVKYLVDLYPESIYLQNRGLTPFHYALRHVKGKYKDDVIRYFLELDPSFATSSAVASRGRRSGNILPLHAACIKWGEGGGSRRLEVVKTLFDYDPRAVMVADPNEMLPVELVKEAMAKEKEESPYSFEIVKHKKAISFLETQYPFVAEASNSEALNTPDENGVLLLHRALLEKHISLGTVEMIVEGTNHHNAAMRGPNPLHLACANCAPDIIQYLSGVYSGLVNSVDVEGCNLLHIACKSGNLKAAKYLLEQHAPLVSETNNANLLPIHLLCDKSGKDEFLKRANFETIDHWRYRTSRIYIGLIWQLLVAYPTTVMSSAIDHDHLD